MSVDANGQAEAIATLPAYAGDELAALAPGELLDLMFADEDRVPRAVIDACARHGDRMVEALEQLDAPYHPEEEALGAWWLNLHAVMILGLIPTEAAGLLALRFLRLADEVGDEDLQDWLAGYWSDFLANKPRTVIEAAREVWTDRSLGWYTRANVLDAVVAAAERRGPEALDEELDRLAVAAADETEDWEVRVSCAQTLLDFPRPRHRPLLQDFASRLEELASRQGGLGAAFRAGDVDKAYAEGDSPEWRWHNDPWKFYRPEEIAERRARWARGEGKEENPYDGPAIA